MESSRILMEKPPSTKSINKILKLLPKVSQAAVSFQNPSTFSPRRDHRLSSSNPTKGFSGSIIPYIPNERSSSKTNNYESTQDPTSPKISCMGQIKQRHKMCKQQQKKILQSQKKVLAKSVSYLNPRQVERTIPRADDSKKEPPTGMSKFFGSSRGRKSDASVNKYSEPNVKDTAPSLVHMKRFASSRDTLAGFDWTSVRNGSDDHDEEDRDDVIIPFSAPIIGTKHGGSRGGDGDLEPRKEINLWKRRTMAQPEPIRLEMLGKKQ